MRSPADVHGLLRSAYERQVTTWLADPSAAARSIPLHPPTAAAALADPASVGDWVAAWRDAPLHGATLHWEPRRWQGMGRQEVPARLELPGATSLARWAGRGTDWALLSERYSQAAARLGVPAGQEDGTDALAGAMRRHLARWREMTSDEVERVLRAAAWFLANPRSGLRIRQVPLPGMHTKWLRPHRALLTSLLSVAGADPEDPLGLIGDAHFADVVFLDPALRPGGIRAMRLEQAELRHLSCAPRVVLVCENAETVQVLGDLPGVVALHGKGYSVPELLAPDWVRRARVLYWGDLDGHGFAVLHRARAHHPDVTSVLMDSETLHRHRSLWGTGDTGAPVELAHLTAQESATRCELAELGEVQLEQERIELPYAIQHLREAAAALNGEPTLTGPAAPRTSRASP